MLVCDPEKVRTRAADLITTGREFLEASWSVAALGADAPIDVEQLGGSGFVDLAEVIAAAEAGGHPWWTLSQLHDPDAVELDVRAAPTARDRQGGLTGARVAVRDAARPHRDRRGGRGGHPGIGTARRTVEQLSESNTPATVLEPGATPPPARWRCWPARCTTG